jgi:uncharacterized RDD family membrane protein YckC
MTKKRLDDIFRERIISRKERNSHGEWEVVEKVYHEKRRVDTLSSPLRLINYFVDLLIISLIIRLAYFFLDFNQAIIWDFLILIVFFGYYTLFEFYFQRTIGKYLTGSLVVNEYGDTPDFKTICLRTIIRIIPLNPYSFFWTDDHRFWHDTWTKTFVVSKDELSLIRRIQSGEKPKKSDTGQWDEWHNWQQGV